MFSVFRMWFGSALPMASSCTAIIQSNVLPNWLSFLMNIEKLKYFSELCSSFSFAWNFEFDRKHVI